LVNSACRLTGHDALAITQADGDEATRKHRLVDYTLARFPTMARPPRKRTHVTRHRGAAKR
jgi:hypothetical protein